MNTCNPLTDPDNLGLESWSFCGCCGREMSCSIQDGVAEWCFDCYQHIRRYGGGPPWDRTYFAIHGKECPFAESPDDDGGGLRMAA